MSKDHIRDYATAAFRYWASQGCPTYEEAVERIKNRAINKAKDVDPARALIYAEAEVEKRAAELSDIMACEACFKHFQECGKGYICDAVKAVYMPYPGRKLRRRELSGRVLRYSQDNYLSVRTAYYYLNQACCYFASLHNLRISTEDL